MDYSVHLIVPSEFNSSPILLYNFILHSLQEYSANHLNFIKQK